MSREAFIAEFNPQESDIVICGSMSHRAGWSEVADKLRGQGLKVETPDTTEHVGWAGADDETIAREKGWYMRQHFALIARAGAILVYNDQKNGIPNYVGGNTFLEMGVAFAYGKPIYVYNELPDQPNREEMVALNPTIIHGDVSKIEVGNE